MVARMLHVDLEQLDRHADTLDPAVLALVRRALSRERGGRFQTAAAFREAI